MTNHNSSFLITEALAPYSMEQQGTKPKFWYISNEERLLFKEGKIHGENWAEVIASEIANFIGLPSANYFPATYKGRSGVITPSFIKGTDRLITANELFIKKDYKYAEQSMWKRKDYKLNTSLVILENLTHNNPAYPIQLTCDHPLLRPVEQFVGYLLFDCLIANVDRHDENWGLIHTGDQLILAPSYDHASSLACREPEEKRIDRLSTTDKGYSIEKFSLKAKTPFIGLHNKQLKTTEIADNCHRLYGFAFSLWAQKFSTITRDKLTEIIAMLPNNWMTEAEKEFTIRLVEINRDFIVSLSKGHNQ